MVPYIRLLTTLFFVTLYVYALPNVRPRSPNFLAPPPDARMPANHSFGRRQSGTFILTQQGDTGVSAMMFVVINPTMVLILDKVEHNPLTTPNGNPAWGALYNMQTHAVTPLQLQTNTFCAGGAFISNGSFVSTGGNGIQSNWETYDGIQGLRLLQPCASPTGSGCTIFEDPVNFHLLTNRWYPTVVRLYDGTAMIMGGHAFGGAFYNDLPGANMASYEYFPKKWWQPTNVLTTSDILLRTTPVNLFPISFALTDGKVFIASNNQTVVYDTDYNYEIVLPDIPDGYRVIYPFTAGATLLPLLPPYYICEVLICGGTNTDDSIPQLSLSAHTPASDRCFRMPLTQAGVDAGWQTEIMPEARVMPDIVTLPNGEIIILNGGQTGAAGYGSFFDDVGQSNADDPAYSGTRYNAFAPPGSRFSKSGMPTSDIPRMYHSVATLTPMGNVMITGSNPNADVITAPGWPYPSEFRVEWLDPPYMSGPRPVLTSPPTQMSFNTEYTFTVSIPEELTDPVYVTFIDIGFVTHSVHSTDRVVLLNHVFNNPNRTSITITSPRDGGVYPPGPGWLFISVDGIVGEGKRVMIGTGGNPPVPYF